MRNSRIFLSFVTLLIVAGTMQAQEETLLGGGFESGGYGGPVVKFTNFNGKFAVMVGGYGGWLINHSFMIGGGGYGLVTSHYPDHPPQVSGPANLSLEGSRMEFGYGGGMLEYIFKPTSVVHSSVSLLIGAGEVSLRYHDAGTFWDMMDGYEGQKDGVFVLEPSVNVELNVTTFFRVNAGGSYRLVSGASMYGLTNKDLSGPSINLALKFGAF